MKLKIELDLNQFDKKELSKEEWNRYIWKLNLLDRLAKKYLDENKISKTMYNRITRLWLFLPREKESNKLMSSEQFNNLFQIDNLDLIKTQTALNKIYEVFQNERNN